MLIPKLNNITSAIKAQYSTFYKIGSEYIVVYKDNESIDFQAAVGWLYQKLGRFKWAVTTSFNIHFYFNEAQFNMAKTLGIIEMIRRPVNGVN